MRVNDSGSKSRAGFTSAPTQNVTARISGARWPEEQLILGGHHDTVFGAAGGNDNASGVITVLETARVAGCDKEGAWRRTGLHVALCHLQRRGAATSAGSAEFARRHCGPGSHTRLVLNLDELSTGHMKGCGARVSASARINGSPTRNDERWAEVPHYVTARRCLRPLSLSPARH